MCCRTEVSPLLPDIARVMLTIGGFVPQGDPENESRFETAITWRRDITEENCAVTVTLEGGVFRAGISPSISSYPQHAGKRITAGVYFEICAKYAEKVDGTVTQKANVAGCKVGDEGVSSLIMAVYPGVPLTYERACRGFQELILSDHGHDDAA
jgi:hypothetical protein